MEGYIATLLVLSVIVVPVFCALARVKVLEKRRTRAADGTFATAARAPAQETAR